MRTAGRHRLAALLGSLAVRRLLLPAFSVVGRSGLTARAVADFYLAA